MIIKIEFDRQSKDWVASEEHYFNWAVGDTARQAVEYLFNDMEYIKVQLDKHQDELSEHLQNERSFLHKYLD